MFSDLFVVLFLCLFTFLCLLFPHCLCLNAQGLFVFTHCILSHFLKLLLPILHLFLVLLHGRNTLFVMLLPCSFALCTLRLAVLALGFCEALLHLLVLLRQLCSLLCLF